MIRRAAGGGHARALAEKRRGTLAGPPRLGRSSVQPETEPCPPRGRTSSRFSDEARYVTGDLQGALDRLRAAQQLARAPGQTDFIEASVIDARMKPSYPDELYCDPETAALVDRRWREYFPDRDVEMGDSGLAHLDPA